MNMSTPTAIALVTIVTVLFFNLILMALSVFVVSLLAESIEGNISLLGKALIGILFICTLVMSGLLGSFLTAIGKVSWRMLLFVIVISLGATWNYRYMLSEEATSLDLLIYMGATSTFLILGWKFPFGRGFKYKKRVT